jgi:hypothetical protein
MVASCAADDVSRRCEKIAELRRRPHHRAIRYLWPDEAATLQPLGVKRHGETGMPKTLEQLAAPAAEDVEIAPMRITPERLLNLQDQRAHATPHVGWPVAIQIRTDLDRSAIHGTS